MDIYRLYQLIRMWEVALTLTKPDDIQSIKVKPVIYHDSDYYGEGTVWGHVAFTLEKEDAYTTDTIIDISEEYTTIEGRKEAERVVVTSLTDYLEQYLKDDHITLIWDQIDELALDWYEKPLF